MDVLACSAGFNWKFGNFKTFQRHFQDSFEKNVFRKFETKEKTSFFYSFEYFTLLALIPLLKLCYFGFVMLILLF